LTFEFQQREMKKEGRMGTRDLEHLLAIDNPLINEDGTPRVAIPFLRFFLKNISFLLRFKRRGGSRRAAHPLGLDEKVCNIFIDTSTVSSLVQMN